MKIYYRILRDFTAAKVLAGLIANPERYRYIAEKVANLELSQYEADQKHVSKAILIAEHFVSEVRK